jgi:hypothetical protein
MYYESVLNFDGAKIVLGVQITHEIGDSKHQQGFHLACSRIVFSSTDYNLVANIYSIVLYYLHEPY